MLDARLSQNTPIYAIHAVYRFDLTTSMVITPLDI